MTLDPLKAVEKRAPILGEFREFIARGNVIDLAVGVILGAAFGDIVKSLVDQVVMPVVGLVTSGIDFAHLKWVLKPDNPATKVNEQVAIQYGAFLNTMLAFLLIAWVGFLVLLGEVAGLIGVGVLRQRRIDDVLLLDGVLVERIGDLGEQQLALDHLVVGGDQELVEQLLHRPVLGGERFHPVAGRQARALH